MQKVFAVLFTVCSTLVLGVQSRSTLIHIFNNAGKGTWIGAEHDARWCECLSNTQTAKIRAENAGVVRLFSSTDCPGKFQTLGSDDTIENAQWVNSVSWGKGGIPSQQWDNGCPNLLA